MLFIAEYIYLKHYNEWVMWIKLAALILLLPAFAMTAVADDANKLIQDLNDSSPVVRIAAAEALGKLNDTRAVEPLIQALNDEDVRVRWHAIVSLGKLNDTRAVEPLIQSLNDEDWMVQGAAAHVLGNLNDTRAVEPLIRLINDEKTWVRTEAELSLKKLGWQAP
jgi:HEAT repeat protein